jgi:hypothetical protein
MELVCFVSRRGLRQFSLSRKNDVVRIWNVLLIGPTS